MDFWESWGSGKYILVEGCRFLFQSLYSCKKFFCRPHPVQAARKDILGAKSGFHSYQQLPWMALGSFRKSTEATGTPIFGTQPGGETLLSVGFSWKRCLRRSAGVTLMGLEKAISWGFQKEGIQRRHPFLLSKRSSKSKDMHEGGHILACFSLSWRLPRFFFKCGGGWVGVPLFEL